MRLLYILNARIPSERAHGIQVMHTCEALARQGSALTLIVPWRFGRIKEDPFLYYGVDRVFRIVRLPSIDLSVLGRVGFWVCSFSFSLSVWAYLLCVRPAVIYGRDELPLLGATILRFKTFWEAHDGRWNSIVRRLLRRLSGLIVITRGLAEEYQKKGYTGSVHIAPDGVDLRDFSQEISQAHVRNQLKLPQHEPLVFYIGSLQLWKGVETFLQASQNIPKARFVVVGGYAHEIARLKERFPGVFFLGERPYKELPLVQGAADVLVIPNTARVPISARYTSPLKLFAHMASGVPIVASDVPSLREVLTDETALFFEPDNPVDLVRAVREALDAPAASHDRAERAKGAVRRYDWNARARGIKAFLA